MSQQRSPRPAVHPKELLAAAGKGWSCGACWQGSAEGVLPAPAFCASCLHSSLPLALQGGSAEEHLVHWRLQPSSVLDEEGELAGAGPFESKTF